VAAGEDLEARAADAADAAGAGEQSPAASVAANGASRTVAAQPAEERQTVAATEPAKQATPTPATRREPAAQPSASAAASGAFQVQLGSFGEEENARRLAQRVSTFGYRPAISNTRSSGRTMYRVRVGPHGTRDEASAVASSLAAHGFLAQVVSAD
jgi:cell division septation protein DedD